MKGKTVLEALSKEELITIVQEQNLQLEILNGKVSKLERRISLMRKLISRSPQQPVKEEAEYKIQTEVKFDMDWTWITKLEYIIQSEIRPLMSSEIQSLLLKYDYKTRDIKNLKKTLSVHLNQAAKYKRIIPLKISGLKSYYFALPEWIDKEGELLKEYKIRPKFNQFK